MRVGLVRSYFSGTRKHFLYPEDRYEHWVILAAVEGEFEFSFGDGWEKAGRGDIVLCPPGDVLRRRADEPLGFWFCEFVWYGPDERPLETSAPLGRGRQPALHPGRILSTLQLIRDYGEDYGYDADPEYLNHLIADILHLCIWSSKRSRTAVFASDPLMEQAAETIRLKAGEPLTLGDLAESAGLSRSQFTRRFQAAFGVSPAAYLTRIRMRMGRTLLLETGLTLDEIAERCGYQNGFYFSRVFRKVHGMSPSAFRRAHRV